MGRGGFIGARSAVLPHLSFGEFAVVGAGTVVNKDVEAGAVMVGKPAGVTAKENSTNFETADGSWLNSAVIRVPTRTDVDTQIVSTVRLNPKAPQKS